MADNKEQGQENNTTEELKINNLCWEKSLGGYEMPNEILLQAHTTITEE